MASVEVVQQHAVAEIARPGRSHYVLALAGGVFWSVCWANPAAAPAIPLSFLLLLLGLSAARTTRQAVVMGLLWDCAREGLGGSFVAALTAVSPLGIFIYLLLYLYMVPFAVGQFSLAMWIERRLRVHRAIPLALTIVVTERLRGATDLSLPADQWAHAFGDGVRWLSWVPFLGPQVVCAWGLGVGALLWIAWNARARRGLAAGAAVGALLLWIGPPLTALATPSQAATGASTSAPDHLRVALVQPSFSLSEKLDPANAGRVWSTLRQLTLDHAKGVDLVVWPETVRPEPLFWKESEPFHDREVEEIARDAGVPILYGCRLAQVDAAGKRVVKLYNAAALARPDGSSGTWYGKQRLVPFMEGVPFGPLFGYDPSRHAGEGHQAWLTLLGNFVPGPGPVVFEVGKARIGALICYEGLYGELTRVYRGAGANVVAVLVNDTWWGKTYFADHVHAGVLSSRALETGLPMIRSGNNGVSCAVDASGRPLASLGLDRRGTLVADVPLAQGPPTLYSRVGDLFVWLAVLGVLALSVTAFVKRPVAS